MNIFLQTLLFALAVNIGLFFVAFVRKTDKLTDFAYGLTFIVVALFSILRSSHQTLSSFILLFIISMWAFRLGAYLVLRIRKINRDKRFDGIRENFFRFGTFWVAQGISVWIIMLPSIYFFTHPSKSVSLLMLIGGLVWVVGYYFESVGDLQKYEFINDPKNKGKWIDKGLWKRSRHPNYFGEITMWVGVYLFCLSVMPLSVAIIALASPLWIAILLLFISGIPKLEKQADERWGKDKAYRKYRDSTPLLIPKL